MRKIILASRSPMRKFILEKIGLSFEVVPSDYKELHDESRTVQEVTEELGLGKALDVADKYPESIVIGGDTIVAIDGKQLGKPKDEQDARDMLKSYSDRSHQVVSSVAVICKELNYEKVSSSTTNITFDKLDDTFIERYIATRNPFDKAGGYAIQHPIVRPHVKLINGRIDAILGLPSVDLCKLLSELDIDVKPLDISNKDFLNKDGFFE